MCDYTQVEYSCGHFRFRAQRWCSHYERTHRVCPPNITTGELRGDELCTDCRPHKPAPWAHMIGQRRKHKTPRSRRRGQYVK
ncbi:hypothetical protein PG989_000009 [Apiospora arundinis]|uniref:Uncharacterized protein n=2 Tax=Apiospora TaxID=1811811 RepID=A0ABR2IX37_9PEZI